MLNNLLKINKNQIKIIKRNIETKHKNIYLKTKIIEKEKPEWVDYKKRNIPKKNYPPKLIDKKREIEEEKIMKINENAKKSNCRIKWRYFASKYLF